MIKSRNICKSYNGVTALDNISFDINRAELFGFIGPDGAGKTSLFRIITTLLLPNSGEMKVMGYDTDKDYRDLRKRIGYMPGRFSLYTDLTVEENLNFYATVFGTTVKENYHLIKDIYSHIEPFKKRQAGKLSGGMKQKLALSCALIHAPKLIVLDEPTTGIDAVSRTEFWEMLRNLQKKDITIVVSTPYMDEADRCDRVALMQSGKILKTDRPEAITESFGRKLFAVTAKNRFNLILKLKEYPGIDTAYPFGDSIHITFRNEDNVKDLLIHLSHLGITDAAIAEIKPGIEDTFLKLMKPAYNE